MSTRAQTSRFMVKSEPKMFQIANVAVKTSRSPEVFSLCERCKDRHQSLPSLTLLEVGQTIGSRVMGLGSWLRGGGHDVSVHEVEKTRCERIECGWVA